MFTTQEEKQFWAEIDAQAERDARIQKEQLKLHKKGLCHKPTCCEEWYWLFVKGERLDTPKNTTKIQ